MKTQLRPILATVATALLTSSLAMGCGDPPPPATPKDFTFGIEVSVTDQDRAGVARVPVTIDGQVVGFTDKAGKFEGRITDKHNTPIELALGDIDGYRFTTTQTKAEKLTVRRGVSGEPQGLPISLIASVHSLKNDYLVWIRMECDEMLGAPACADLQIKMNNEVVAKTDIEGKAHLSFEGIVGRKVAISVVTPIYNPNAEKPMLFEPQNPAYELTLGMDTTVYLIEDTFTDPAARARPVKRSPVRSTVPRRAAEPKKEAPKSDSNIINLW
ncbi:MAG: hypothetical protein H0U74_06445 [Bradymonadaceae bacterium]|nr:hypothetical protein [Lujinxingiaceae bacterium]